MDELGISLARPAPLADEGVARASARAALDPRKRRLGGAAARWSRSHTCLESGELRLPLKELDGWKAVTTQVAEWLDQLVEQRQTPHLMAIEGTPRQGVTFLYSAEVVRCATKGIWLDADVTAPTLNQRDRQLLLLSEGKGSDQASKP